MTLASCTMDEPSTGLDPASRRNLWDVIEKAKPGRAIVLTTHSMEEAEHLCNRLGILLDGMSTYMSIHMYVHRSVRMSIRKCMRRHFC